MNEASEFVGASRVSGQIGQGLDALHSEARNAAEQARGGKKALAELAGKMAGLHTKADHEFGEDLETLAKVKRYVTYAIESATNLAQKKEAEEWLHRGQADMAERAVKLAQRHHDTANARVAQLTAPPEPDEEKPRRRRKRSLAEAKAEEEPKPKPKPRGRRAKAQAKATEE